MPCSPLLLESGSGIALDTSSFEAGRRAAAHAVSTITTFPLSVVMVFVPAGHVPEEALRGVRSVTGGAPLIGTAIAGEIRNGLPQGNVSVTVLASPHLLLRYAVGAGVEEIVADPRLAPCFSPDGERVTELTEQGKSLVGLIFSSAPLIAASPFHEIIDLLGQRSAGLIPFIGLPPHERQEAQSFILAGDEVVVDTLLVALLETELRFAFATPEEIPGIRTLLHGVPLTGLCSFDEDDGGRQSGTIRTLILGAGTFPECPALPGKRTAAAGGRRDDTLELATIRPFHPGYLSVGDLHPG
jgi:FIST N domain